jgi:hypothetical protein
MMNERITEEQVTQARHMTLALLGAMTPYQIAREIGVMYQTVLKIANAQTSWISTQTFEALNALHQSWRSRTFHPDRNSDELSTVGSSAGSSGESAPDVFAPAAQRALNIPDILAEIAKLEKRLVILHRIGDLADQM